MLFPSTKTAVEASGKENRIQKLGWGIRTQNSCFPQLVNLLFADGVMVLAARSDSFDTKFFEQVVKRPMKTTKDTLARTKLR